MALSFESPGPEGWRRERIEPRALWIQPANQPFGFRVKQTARWGAVVLDLGRMRAAIGAEAAVEASIATQLLRLYGEANAQAKGGITGRKVRLLTDFIDNHLQRDLSLAELAGLAGLSTFHFARALKQSTGRTPHQFVLARRLERARRLLVDTQESVASIAALCGFADQAHLTRTFRKHFGTVPTALREAQQVGLPAGK